MRNKEQVQKIFPCDRKSVREASIKFRYVINSPRDEDFERKWLSTPCEIIVVEKIEEDKWERERFEKLLIACRLIANCVKGVVVIEDSEYGQTLADKLAHGHADSFILCDLTGKNLSALLPSDAITKQSVDRLGAKGAYYHVSAEYELIPDDVIEAFQFAQITTAEAFAHEATGTTVTAFSGFNDETSSEIRRDVATIYDIMSLGKVKMPQRGDYGLPEETAKNLPGLDMVLATPFVFSISLNKDQQAYVEALEQATITMTNINLIWETLLYDSPFTLRISRAKAERYDPNMIKYMANAIGADRMISALVDHSIPINDVLAGRQISAA